MLLSVMMKSDIHFIYIASAQKWLLSYWKQWTRDTDMSILSVCLCVTDTPALYQK